MFAVHLAHHRQITNNEVRGHLFKSVGAGLRIAAIGIGAQNVSGTSRVVMRDNNLVGNTLRVIIEAGFPVATGSLHGDLDITMGNNMISQSC